MPSRLAGFSASSRRVGAPFSWSMPVRDPSIGRLHSGPIKPIYQPIPSGMSMVLDPPVRGEGGGCGVSRIVSGERGDSLSRTRGKHGKRGGNGAVRVSAS